MKKLRYCFVLAAMLISNAVFAVDFGGLLNNLTTIKTNKDQNFKLDQKDSASLWFKTVFDETGMNYFIADFIYDFERDFDADKTTNIIDSDLFKLNLGKKLANGKIGLSAGRFFYSDLSGLVFAQNADGVLFNYKGNRFDVSVYGAYTGLLNALNVKMITAERGVYVRDTDRIDDVYDHSFYRFKPVEGDKDKLYDFAEQYAVGGLTVSFPNLFARQTVAAQFIGAFRLEKELFNRMYATISVNGPVVDSLYYNASSTFGFTKFHTNGTEIANLSKINLDYYFSKFDSCIGANAVYASGDRGFLMGFTGITSINPTLSLADIEYSGIFKFGLSSSMKILHNLQLAGACDMVYDISNGHAERPEGAYEQTGINDSNTGFQYTANINWQLLSDILLSANVSQFFAKNNEDIKKTTFGIRAVISF